MAAFAELQSAISGVIIDCTPTCRTEPREAHFATTIGQLGWQRLPAALHARQASMPHSSVRLGVKQAVLPSEGQSQLLDTLAFIAIASMLFSLK